MWVGCLCPNVWDLCCRDAWKARGWNHLELVVLHIGFLEKPFVFKWYLLCGLLSCSMGMVTVCAK